jgi:predicted methyltransferase
LRRSVLNTLIALIALGVSFTPAAAQDQSVRPGVNQHYQNTDFDRWVTVFERPGREVFDQRHQILDAVGLRSGMAVADIGAGTGLFTKLFSPAVGPQGTVYAVDITAEFVANIERLARDRGLDNVMTIRNSVTDVILPEHSIELAFICNTYHHFEYPRRMLKSIHRALQPKGRLIIIDYRKLPGVSSAWVMGHVRADRQTVIDEIEDQGFRLIDEKDVLRANYFLEFFKVGL